MTRFTSSLLMILGLAAAAPAAAQMADTTRADLVREQAISFLPIHAIFGFYAGELERTVGQTTTLGVGGSYFDLDDFTYSTVEAKLRYYPSGDPLRGLSFGMTAGPTFLTDDEDSSDQATAIGIGVEIARSHILGVDRRFYYGYGAGAKRLFFTGEEADGVQLVLPTLRLSVGYAF